MNIYRLGACLKCRGDLAHDEGDWICLQCGVYYYTGLYDSSGHNGDGRLRVATIDPGPRYPSGLHTARSVSRR